MRFDVLTLFPEMFRAVLGESITGRAEKNNLIEFSFVNIRDYSLNKHRKTDDYPYSGGGGMIMTPQPVCDAYKSITENLDYKPHTVYMSPQGKVLTQQRVKELSELNHIVIICGHYEGMDERVIEEIVDEEISIGDYVLTGGEIPAMALIDSVSRMINGVLSTEKSYTDESHYSGLLEYPQYTRPPEYNGRCVPDILLSGNHAAIEKWKRQHSLINTAKKRPDMLKKAQLTDDDRNFLNEYFSEKEM